MYTSMKNIRKDKDDEPNEFGRTISQITMTSLFRDWAGIPEHILDLIVSKFGPLTLSDYFCFSAICSQWRSVMKLNRSLNIFFHILKLSCKVPMLMIKTEENNNERRGLFSVLNGITHNVRLPLPYYYRFIGSSHGWLLCLDENLVITLLDPFNNGSISLPSFGVACQVFNDQRNEHCFDYYIQKAILTSDPHACPNDYKVVVIYHSLLKLAYYESSQHCWKFIKLEPEEEYRTADITYHDGCIYSVTYFGELVRFHFQDGYHKQVVSAPRREANGANSFYLVESQNGNLLLIKRFWIDHDKGLYNFPRTFTFKVFKYLRAHCGKCCASARWQEIDDIGEQALFIGGSTHSVSVSTIKYSEILANSIYYTAHDHMDVASYEYFRVNGNSDSGIFDLEDKRFRSHHVLGPLEKYIKPPIWFVPNIK